MNPTTEEVLGVSELQARKNALEAKFDEQFPHLKIEKERQRKAKEDQKKQELAAEIERQQAMEKEAKMRQVEAEQKALRAQEAAEAEKVAPVDAPPNVQVNEEPKVQKAPHNLSATFASQTQQLGAENKSPGEKNGDVDRAVSRKLSKPSETLMTRDSEDASPEKQPVSEAEILAHIEDMEKKIRHLKQLTLLRREERDKSVEGLTPVLLKVLQNVGRWPITGVRLDRSSPTKAKKRSPSKTISLREKEAQNLKELHDRRKEKPIVINKGLLEQAEKLQNDLQSHNVQRKSTIVGKEWGQLKNAPQKPPTASTASFDGSRMGQSKLHQLLLGESNGTVDVDTYVTKTPGYKGKSVRKVSDLLSRLLSKNKHNWYSKERREKSQKCCDYIELNQPRKALHGKSKRPLAQTSCQVPGSRYPLEVAQHDSFYGSLSRGRFNARFHVARQGPRR